MAACTAGCNSSASRQIQIESAAAVKPYNTVTLNYRVDAGRRGLPVHLARQVRQQVTFEQSASSPYPDQSMGTLSIQYPHPDGRPDYALAELIIEDSRAAQAAPPTSGWKSWLDGVRRAARDHLPGIKLDDGVREAWAMDVPRAEIDRVLAQLGGMGYFTPTAMAPSGVRLAAQIDGAKFNKAWVQVSELDAMAQRIRGEGRLVSYLRPPGQVDPWADGPQWAPPRLQAPQFAMMPAPQPTYQHAAPPQQYPWGGAPVNGQGTGGPPAPQMGYAPNIAGPPPYAAVDRNPFAAPIQAAAPGAPPYGVYPSHGNPGVHYVTPGVQNVPAGVAPVRHGYAAPYAATGKPVVPAAGQGPFPTTNRTGPRTGGW